MYYLGSPGSSPRKKEIYQAQSSMTIASSDSSKAMSPSQSTEDGLLIKPMMLIVCVQSYLTLSNPMIHSPPGSSAHGIFQARILQWVAISSSRGSSQLRNQTHISMCPALAGRFFTPGATCEALCQILAKSQRVGKGVRKCSL